MVFYEPIEASSESNQEILVTRLHDNTSDEVNLINYLDAKGELVESKTIDRIIKTGNV